MKTDIIKQEILLVIPAFEKEFCEKNHSKNFSSSKGEQLEEACWNGLLSELLTGIIETPPYGKRLCIWEIRHSKFLLEIELCDYPQMKDENLSIDPYIFFLCSVKN